MRRATAFGSMMVILAGCASDRGSGPGYPTEEGGAAMITLSVTAIDPMTSAGDTQRVTAVVKDANGLVIPATSLSWRTSAPSVATVEGTGASATVTAVDDGTATITAAMGNVEGTIPILVHRRAVSIELLAPESVLVEGTTEQLTVVGRDARQHAMTGLTGATFTSSNGFSVQVSPTGLATALFSAQSPFDANITAILDRDGQTLSATKRIEVRSAAPAAYDVFGYMIIGDVRPEAPNSAGEGIIYLTFEPDRIRYQLQWSLLSGPPIGAHIHGPNNPVADAVDVLIDLPLDAHAGANGITTGSFTAADIRPQGGRPPISFDSLVTLLRSPELAYVDMHTTLFPGGEIRSGFFPHPASAQSSSGSSNRFPSP